MFPTTFKILKQLLRAFIWGYGSFIKFDAYFKALMRFLKLHLGKALLSQ